MASSNARESARARFQSRIMLLYKKTVSLRQDIDQALRFRVGGGTAQYLLRGDVVIVL
jgi:hypothetical protein